MAASSPFPPSAALSALWIGPLLLPTLPQRTPLTLFFAPVGLVAIASPHWLRPRLPPAPSSNLVTSNLKRGTPLPLSLPPSLRQAPQAESPHARRHACLPLRRRLAPPTRIPGCHRDRGGPCGRPALHAQVTSSPSTHLGAQTTPAGSAKRQPTSLFGIVEMVPPGVRVAPSQYIKPPGAVDKATAPPGGERSWTLGSPTSCRTRGASGTFHVR